MTIHFSRRSISPRPQDAMLPGAARHEIKTKEKKRKFGSCSKAKVAGVTGLEPATSGVTGRRSNQTELHPRVIQFAPFGAGQHSEARGVRQRLAGVKNRAER